MLMSRPSALLLDFGGVLVDAPRDPTPSPRLVRRLHELVGGVVSAQTIAADLTGGDRAYALWRDEVGRSGRPVEATHAQVWDDFVTSSWPTAAREAVRREATALSYEWTTRERWEVRPGIPRVLEAARAAKTPAAVVSNTLCGAAHRDFLARVGLAPLLSAQLYSDEVGVRKPNPELALAAAERIGVPIERCWFVGDSLLRDIACARAAGVSAAIIMRSPRTVTEMAAAESGSAEFSGLTPDAVVDDGNGLYELFAAVDPA